MIESSSHLDHHAPVLLGEVCSALIPRAGATFVDGTFGRGGHTLALLEAAPCHVIAIDRDPSAEGHAQEIKRRFGACFTFIAGRFSSLANLLSDKDISTIDGGVLFDLGVSSPQLDDPARGFSFRHDADLDMRMGGDGPTAADLVNQADEHTLTRLLRDLGEERRARAVARAIVQARQNQPITRTGTLAAIIRRVVPKAADGLDPATRSFQAIRMHVNQELEEIDRGLAAAEKVMSEGARLAVIAFHSVEDGVVKRFLRDRSGAAPRTSRHLPPDARAERPPSFRQITRRPIRPTDTEVQKNPRARSARLRVAERTAAPAWTNLGHEDPGS